MIHARIGRVALALALTTPAFAQSNMIPGTDVELGLLDQFEDFASLGHEGPGLLGTASFSMSTTSCNPGTVNVPWQAAMQENHPLISFMVVREDPGSSRLVQISDRSWLKHGFFALSNDQCGYGCPTGSNGTFLAVGCSDTYSIGNNSDRFDLGPPEEIDPWLGTWTANGSFFDCPTGVGCDGIRSYFGNEPSVLTHRILIEDSELDVAGAEFYYYGYYVIRAEPEANRENNGNSRRFVPSWNGFNWDTDESGTNPHLQGTILQRWSGATIASNKNTTGGIDRDGRVYVAWKVTPQGIGYHYEYALHNRDNNGGIGEFRLPLGANANVTAFGFHDVDLDAGNDWGLTLTPTELVLSTPDNPLAWNTVYNFWFDSTSPPTSTDLELVQYTLNPSAAASFTVAVEGPGDGPGGSFPVLCNGDGGDQLGCTDCPCGNNAAPGSFGGCLNSSGVGALLIGSGDASVSADTLRFEATGLPANAFTILNSGDAVAPQNMANPCFGLGSGAQSVSYDGLRCAVQNTQRHGGRNSDVSGTIGMTNNGWGPPSGPPAGLIGQGGFAAGQTRYFQAIHRELPTAVCMRGLNTTQTSEVLVTP